MAELAFVLSDKKSGRPRKPISTFYVPRDVLHRIGSVRLPPFGLRRAERGVLEVFRMIQRAARIRRGPKLSPAIRARNIANGFYAPETVRNIRWKQRKWAALEDRLNASKRDGKWPFARDEPPQPGTPEFLILANVAMRQNLV